MIIGFYLGGGEHGYGSPPKYAGLIFVKEHCHELIMNPFIKGRICQKCLYH